MKKQEIVYKKLTEIKPYKKNPRQNDQAVKEVANSIKEFGFKVPIVIDKKGVIIAGHTRYKAAARLKLEEVPCIVANELTDNQVKAYRLVDNKVSELSFWDDSLLQLELEDIDKSLDMSQFGFELEKIFAPLKPEEKERHEQVEALKELEKTIHTCPQCGTMFED